MSNIYYELKDHIAILTLNYNENQFNPNFISTFLETLDNIENNTKAKTLIVHSSHNKIFSNGIDLKWISNLIENKNTKKIKNFLYLLNDLFKRIITYPLISIAAISGHAFAGGAILACAFDFRFMRSDRGYFCFPEIDLGIPFLPGMNELIKKAIPINTIEYMEYTGVRFTSKECKKQNIIIEEFDGNILLEKTIEFAKKIKKQRRITKEMKKRLNSSIVKTIDTEDKKYIELEKFYI